MRFLALFALFAVLFTALSATAWAARHVHEPVSRFLAGATRMSLALFGDSSVDGTVLRFHGFPLKVVDACDGVLPFAIYASAVLAFPSRWSAKAIGIALGLPAMALINLARLITLMVLGAWRPDLFDVVHIYVWQSLVIALAMAVWIVWVERLVGPDSGARA